MRKVVFIDKLGRLTKDPKGNTMLMVGEISEFDVDLIKGRVNHRNYTMHWKIEPVLSWSKFVAEIAVANKDLQPIQNGNVAPAAYIGNGHGIAAIKSGIVVASILLKMAPHDTTNYPYRIWEQKVVEELRRHGEVWAGSFKQFVFEKSISF